MIDPILLVKTSPSLSWCKNHFKVAFLIGQIKLTNASFLTFFYFSTDYARAGKLFYKFAIEANERDGDYYPIWGTCLGFELLALVSNNDQPNLKRCFSMDQYLPLSNYSLKAFGHHL
jgi:hypothetical protein